MTQIQQPPSLGAPILNEKPGLSSDPKPPTVGSTINEKSEKAAQLPNGDSSHDHYHRQHDNGVQDDGSLPKSLVQKEKRPNGLIVDEKVEQPKANGIDHESPPTSTSSDSLATPKPYEQPSTNATPAPPAVPAKDEVVASPTEASPISKPEAQTQAHATAKSTPDAPSHPQKPVAGPSRHVLATYVASNPTHTVKEAIRSQFPKANPIVRLARRFKVKHSVIKGMTEKEWAHYDARGAELRKKAGWKMKEGEEGKEVSELFWKVSVVVCDVLCALGHMSGAHTHIRCTSPSCLHSSGIHCPVSPPPTCSVAQRLSLSLSSRLFPTLCGTIAKLSSELRRRSSSLRTIGNLRTVSTPSLGRSRSFRI